MSGLLTAPDSRPRTERRPRGTSFVGLVGVEVRRLWWRRLTKAAVMAVVVLTGAMVYNAYNASAPERLAQQLDDYKLMVAQAPQMVADCKKQEAMERDRAGDPSIDFGCSQQTPPTLEQMGLALPVADSITEGIARTGALVIAFLALLLGASFVGAEFTTGAMGTWLTFQPRRLRVATSKLGAAALGGVALAVVGLTLGNLGARMVAVVNRPGDDLVLPDPPALDEPVAVLGLRVVALALGAGLVGASLGLVLRHTAAIIGVVLGYAVVVEGIVVQTFLGGRLQQWSVLHNLEAFLSKGATYYANTCTDARCEYAEHTITFTHGWVFLLCVVVALALAGVLTFRRRDVS